MAFVTAYPGRTMPGFDEKGIRSPSRWNGDDITEDTKVQWRNMQRNGSFKISQHKDGKTLPDFSAKAAPAKP